MAEIVFLSEKNRARYLRIITPLGNVLAGIGVHPNVLSVAGFILSIVAGLFYSSGSFFWGAWVLVVAGTCDALDGLIARQNNKNSKFGAFFDSTLDRYSDMFPLMGLAYHFAGGPALKLLVNGDTGGDVSPLTVIIIFLAIAGSFMVSYSRAKAEALGIECKVGLMQRPERVTLLVIGSLLGAIPSIGPTLLQCTLLVLAISTNLTATHRIFHDRNQILGENRIK